MAITIAGWEVNPEAIIYRPSLVGGGIRRSLNGTGYRKIVATKGKLSLPFPFVDADEMQIIRVIFEQAKAGSVTITCDEPYISGSFLLADEDLPFDPLEGSEPFWKGSLSFEEV